MWTVIHLAKGREAVLKLRDMLVKNDILVVFRKNTDDDNEDTFYELLVPQTEVVRAQDLIIEAEMK